MSHYERNFKIFSVIHVHSKSKYDLNFVPSRKSSLLTLIYLKSLVRWGFPLTDSRHKGLTPQISPGGSHLSPEHFRLSLLPVLNRLWEQTTWLIFGAEIPSQYYMFPASLHYRNMFMFLSIVQLRMIFFPFCSLEMLDPDW